MRLRGESEPCTTDAIVLLQPFGVCLSLQLLPGRTIVVGFLIPRLAGRGGDFHLIVVGCGHNRRLSTPPQCRAEYPLVVHI